MDSDGYDSDKTQPGDRFRPVCHKFAIQKHQKIDSISINLLLNSVLITPRGLQAPPVGL